MKSLQESILTSTSAGRNEWVKIKIEEIIPGIKSERDFIWDEKNDVLSIWSVPNGTVLKMEYWPDDVVVNSFEVAEKFDIYIKNEKELEKFKKCFNCSIGFYNLNKKEYDISNINISNCNINGRDFTHRYFCRFVFNNCDVNLQDGPNALYIKLHRSCKEVTKLYGHDILRKLEIQ